MPGAVLGAAGLWGYTFLSEDSSAFMVVGLHVLISTGLSMLFSP